MIERIERAMASGGVGTPTNFDLSRDCLLIVLIISALPKYQDDILGKFSTLEVTKRELTRYLDMKTQQMVIINDKEDKVNVINTKTPANNTPENTTQTASNATPNTTQTDTRLTKEGMTTGSSPSGRCLKCGSYKYHHVVAVAT